MNYTPKISNELDELILLIQKDRSLAVAIQGLLDRGIPLMSANVVDSKTVLYRLSDPVKALL